MTLDDIYARKVVPTPSNFRSGKVVLNHDVFLFLEHN